jgi:hypothetical protein
MIEHFTQGANPEGLRKLNRMVDEINRMSRMTGGPYSDIGHTTDGVVSGVGVNRLVPRMPKIGMGSDITDHLVAWYLFNGNAKDSSGNGNDGTLQNATVTDDVLNLDGGNDRVDCGAALIPGSATASWTICGWRPRLCLS